ncbi:MAG: phosphatidylserine/phosphatidylglycerophosphate/cardiolipin synthase family protein [Gemmataceae bacterium]|nr:phosphatidylserine/phosphatidylglycerophosphate/cardiolipin synthase family protein [Gemmataceae bacterium]
MPRPFALLAVVALAGCHVPAGKIPGCDGRDRGAVGLIAEDTAATLARRPVRSAAAGVLGATTRTAALAQGFADKRVRLALLPDPPPLRADRPTLDPSEMERFSRHVTGRPASPADIRFFPDPDESIAALEAVIDSAACRVDVLMYLWGPDEFGWRVARRLAAKAATGVPVRVLVDGCGNLNHGEPKGGTAAEKNAAVCWLAAQPNVALVRTRDPGLAFDHRKVTVADGRVAFSGGRNFRVESYRRDHDLDFVLAGPLARELAASFEATWRAEGGRPALPLPDPVPVAAPNATARVVENGPLAREFTRHIYRAVELARRHVYLHNPYFGDPHLLYLLAQARRRGADVRVVLTLDALNPVFDGANKATANRLLAAGCRVYAYPAMTHVKALSVDGVWAYTGTGNFDALSLRQNREVGVVISGGPALAALDAQLFHADMRPEWEVTHPVPLSLGDRLFEVVAATVG